MARITTSVLTPAQQADVDKRLLSTPTQQHIFTFLADRRVQRQHMGDKIRFIRYGELAPALVPLGNSGVTPPSQSLSKVHIDAKIQYYGTWLDLNEQTINENFESVLAQSSLQLGYCMRKTEDILARKALESSVSMINCTEGVNGDNPTNITLEDISGVVRTLRGNDAKYLVEGMPGSDKFGTAPVRDSFFALGHTDLSADLDNNVQNFQHKSQYSQSYKSLPAEEGHVSGCRFLLSTLGSKETAASGLNADVYTVFFVGQEAYLRIGQNGYTSNYMFNPATDPLRQNPNAAMKFASATCITNDAWVLGAKCTLLN